MSGPRDVCVIGAGVSGLCAIKALVARGLSVDAFEKGSQLGGMWRYENDNGASSAYRSLHIDTSRRSLGFPDHPVPEGLPDFLSHAQVLQWLEAYAERFDLARHIAFRTAVHRVAPRDDGTWSVTLADGSVRTYRHVVVANGHLWSPRMAPFPGRFEGEQSHSHHYRTPAPFEGKDVLIVGIGNSAVDIAVDLCRHARHTTISTRRGAWVMPKYLFGVPTDRVSGFIARHTRLPTPWVRAIVGRLGRLALGDQTRFGLPEPAHPIWREHACLSGELLPAIGHGWIDVKPDVSALEGQEVLFADGSRRRYDAIIHATGYRTEFPFLDRAVFDARDHDVPLYRRIVAPDRPGLHFIGLVQPIGPTIPLVEIQSRWLAALIDGALRLPDRSWMQAEIDAHRRAQARYLDSPRYTLEVDFRAYSAQLKADLAKAAAPRVRQAA